MTFSLKKFTRPSLVNFLFEVKFFAGKSSQGYSREKSLEKVHKAIIALWTFRSKKITRPSLWTFLVETLVVFNVATGVSPTFSVVRLSLAYELTVDLSALGDIRSLGDAVVNTNLPVGSYVKNKTNNNSCISLVLII